MLVAPKRVMGVGGWALPRALEPWLVFPLVRSGIALRAASEAALEPHALGVMGFAALAIARDLGPISQTALAERVGVDPTTMSTLADHLEAEAFIHRRPSRSDRRRKLVALTLSGEEAMSGGSAAIAAAERHFLSPLPHLEGHRLRRSLQRLDTRTTPRLAELLRR